MNTKRCNEKRVVNFFARLLSTLNKVCNKRLRLPRSFCSLIVPRRNIFRSIPHITLVGTITVTILCASVISAYASGLTIPANSSFNVNSGTISVPGNITNAGTLSVTTGSITLTGSWANTGTFDKGTGTVTFRGTAQSDITGTNSFYKLTLDTNADGAKTIRFGAGETQSITNTFTVTGYSGKVLTIRSTTNGTRGILDIPASITTGVDYVDVKDNYVNGQNHTITAGDNSTDSGNNVNWIFGTGTPIAITGSIYQSDRTTKLTTQNVRLSVNGRSPVQAAASGGDFTFSNIRVNTGDAIVLWIDDDAVYKGNTITIAQELDITGMAIYAGHVTVRYETGSSITNNNLNTAKGTLTDTDIKYSVSGAGNNNLSVDDGYEFYIPSGYTHAPDGTSAVDDIEIDGTLNAAGNAVTVTGDWDNSAGTYTSGANTTTFSGTSKQTLTSGGITAAKSFNNLTHSGSGELELAAGSAININGALLQSGSGDFDTGANDITCAGLTISTGTFNNDARAGTWDVNGNVGISAGIFTATSGELKVSGDWAFTGGTFTANSGTVTFDGASGSISTLSGDTAFYNLKCVTAGKELDWTVGSDQTVNNALTLTGTSANKVKLRSTSSQSKWDITFPNGAQNVSYVDVQDSDANTNTVTCYNSTNSGNNNANWIFNPLTITSPVDARTVGTTPTIRGTAGAGNTVTIKDISGNTVATTTADANQNYRVAVTTALATGANSLTPYVGLISGGAVSVTVVETPTTSQVPTITSPADGSRIRGNKPVITGSAKASETVTLTAKDQNGNLLLTDAASAVTAASGDYTIQPADYTTVLPKGTNYLSVTVDGVTSAIIDVSLYDPFGVAFDPITNNPIGGAVVTIFNPNGTQCTPGVEIDAADANPQTVGADGAYAYLCVNGNYYIRVSAAGYTYPSSETTFPAGRVVITGSKGENFTVAGAIIEMDHPMDSCSRLLKVTKDVNKKEVAVGDILTYTVTIQNTTASSVLSVYLEDKIPAGFKYIDGKVLLDGQSVGDPEGARPLTFNIGTISAGATRILKYQLVAGSGVSFGKYENFCFARYSDGTIISNTASVAVKVIKDALFDLGTVIGKVFWDWDEDGIQKPVTSNQRPDASGEGRGTIDETGIPNARIVMEDGTVIITDKDGKYHIPGIIPGRHALRLDESTLPDGAYLTTPKAVIQDIRPGLTSKVNFGVRSEDAGCAAQDAGYMAEAPIKITQEKGKPKPRLNAALNKEALEVRDIGGLFEAAEFRIFTNYGLFIDKWYIEIYDKTTGRLFKRFEGGRETLKAPIMWNGMDSKGNFVSPGRTYSYILTVRDKYGKFDKTKQKEFKVLRYNEGPADKKEKLEEDVFGRSKDKNEADIWLKERKVNNLELQAIELKGETILADDIEPSVSSIRLMKNGRVEEEILLESKTGPSVEDILENARVETDLKDSEIDIIVPNGEYEVVVDGRWPMADGEMSMAEGGDGQGADKSNIGIGNGQKAGSNVGIGYTKRITIGEDYFFFIAMGDGEMGYNFTSGDTEPINDDDHFKKGLWLDGKLAYYLKAKIKGKYFITSSLDTKRREKELFKYIDPDKYYPVYGDNSQLSYEAANTQGPLYAMIEWDRSQIMWGDYSVSFDDTEFARFSRTLYGGKAQIISMSQTKFGEPNTKIISFLAKAKQKAAYNEFAGTGGSLYYLKHRYIVEGSDKIQIEVRDKITGLVIASMEQKEGSDYQIDYDNGRIIFWKPVPQIAKSNSIISTHLLDGNNLFVTAGYEYYTKDKYDEWSYGARLSQQIGDYLRIGGTFVHDDQYTEKDFELKGADAAFRLTNDIRFKAEYAESESEEGSNFVSTDGGLSFNEISIAEGAKGKAYGASGEAVFGNLGISAYYKMLGKDFSASNIIANQGTQKFGGAASLDIFPGARVSVRHDVQKLLEDGNLESRAQIGASETRTTTAQLEGRLTDKFDAVVEYRHQEVREKKEEYKSETNKDTDIVAGKITYKPTDKLKLSLEHQETIGSGNDRQTTIGAEAALNKYVSIRASEAIGVDSGATTVGVSANIEDKIDLFTDWTLTSERAGTWARTASAGGKVKLDDASSLYNTYSVTESDKGQRTETAAFGAKKNFGNGYEASIGREISTQGKQVSMAATYSIAKETDGRKIEGTFKQQTSGNGAGAASITNIFGLSGNIDDKWAADFNMERGRVQDLNGGETERLAISAGVGYVDKDKIKASSKLEFRYDNSAEDTRQILAYNAIEGRVTPDLTLFGKANIAHTENVSTHSTTALFKEMVFGAAYRPIYHDKLNLIGKYTFLEDDSPASQSDFKDIEHIRMHVFGLEAVYDLSDKWRITAKGAYKEQDEKVSGFGFTKTETWLLVNRLDYNFAKDWQFGGEYRILSVVQAKDAKQGALLEVSRKIGEFMKVGAGYNFTDFSDDLTDLDYTVHGPFVRLTGDLYDRTSGEIERAKKKDEEEKIEKWTWELINEELARPDSAIMKELYNYFYLAQTARKDGRLKETREFYAKIIEIGKRMRKEAADYVRNRVELEKKLKSYCELGKIYYKEGRLVEARNLWHKAVTEAGR